MFACYSHADVLSFFLIIHISILYREHLISACLLFAHCAGSTLSVNDTVLLVKLLYNISTTLYLPRNLDLTLGAGNAR